jgi:transketolase
MRNTVIRVIGELINEGHDLHLFTGDLGFRILDDFRAKHPTCFTNAGVAEANMISAAAGLAMTGTRAFCYSMVPFVFMRAFEQVRLDLCSQRTPVTVIGVGGGLSYGCESHSHFAIEDVALARALPNLTVYAPGDPHEAACAIRVSSTTPGPVYIRLGKNGDPNVHKSALSTIEGALCVRSGSTDILVLATGHILSRSVAAVDALVNAGLSVTLLSIPQLKPFDNESVLRYARKAKLVISIEEHSVVGGLGTEVAELLFSAQYRGTFMKIALPDEYCDVIGTHEHLCLKYELDTESIARRIARAASEIVRNG